jgi:hypothetical protein
VQEANLKHDPKADQVKLVTATRLGEETTLTVHEAA